MSVLFHSSDGGDRIATFLACSILFYTISLIDEFDVTKVVRQIRRSKSRLIRTYVSIFKNFVHNININFQYIRNDINFYMKYVNFILKRQIANLVTFNCFNNQNDPNTF